MSFTIDFVKTKSQSNSKDPYEEFPEKQIKNYNSLKEHIRNAWKLAPNPYVEKKYIKREPLKPIDKTSYTLNMYGSIYSKDKCFCQMCRKLYPNRYIERNDIEKVPSFAWNQMYLSLCLQCSKDFVLMRNNNTIWERFIKDIKNANVLNVGIVQIIIGDRTITFTATHLAEVQEILKHSDKCKT